MALTMESHTLRVRTGGVIVIAALGTGDLLPIRRPDRAQAKALHKNIHHQYSPSSASAKPGRRTKTDLNRDLKP
jgi:hypothetical protein